jgi:hypothetical protein
MNGVPTYVEALLALLRREDPPALPEAGWRELLRFADRTQCTLHLRGAAGLPAWVEEQVEARSARNAVRRGRLRAEYLEVARALEKREVPFALLKSFTHEAGAPGTNRVQYDIDVWCPAPHTSRAEAALAELGYAPHGRSELSELHGRPLVRPSRWKWRGDYFDPEMPIPVEVHARLWNESATRIPAPGVESFWDRRSVIDVDGMKLPALAETDRLAFAALHALRHILYNDARPAHVFELAGFVEARASAGWFGDAWRETHSEPLRRLQTVGFRFALEWFGGRFPAALDEEWRLLPPAIHDWFRAFAWSPIRNLVQPNKDAVWLYAPLIPRRWDRWRTVVRRLAPISVPQAREAVDLPYAAYLLGRARYHTAALAPALLAGWRAWRKASSSATATSDWNRPRV